MDLEEAHVQLVRRIHAIKRIPKLIEAEGSQERETMLDPVSSEEDFYLSHLNKSFDNEESIDKAAFVNSGGGSHTNNPNLVAIATYEQSKSNSADQIKVMRSSTLYSSLRQYSIKKCEARLGYHSRSRSKSRRRTRNNLKFITDNMKNSFYNKNDFS